MDEEIDQLKKLEQEIAEYEKVIGFTIPNKNPELLNEYLSLSGSELLTYTWQELTEICIDVAALLIYLQREYNKHKMRSQWCSETIEHIVGEQIRNYKGYTYKEKFVEAVAHMDITRKLHKIQQREQAAVESGSYLIQRIESWLDYINDLKHTKRKAEFDK